MQVIKKEAAALEKIEELKLRLKIEEEAHQFWKNKWAELNNNITKGDNE